MKKKGEKMRCQACSAIVYNENQKKCSVCGAWLNELDWRQRKEKECVQAVMERKQVSRVTAWFVAWIGCGLLLPKYLGDEQLFSRRIRSVISMLPWCLLLVGFFFILIYLLVWSLSDQLNCICGTMKYSDGTKVWP